MSVTGVSPANHTLVDPTGSGITLTWTTQYTQTHYQIIYRKVGASTWVDSGKVASSAKSFTIPSSKLVKNAYYEWRVRYWYSSSGQSAWTASNVFKSQVPSINRLKVSGGANKVVDLRVVPLGKSELASGVRVSTPSGVGELDLVPLGSEIESGVRVSVKSGVIRGVGRPMPDRYTNYANHANTGYSRYANHSNTGYNDKKDVYTNSGYTVYSNHTNYTEGYYTNHDNTGYKVYPDHADYREYSYYDYGHTDYYSENYSDHNDNGGYSRYGNHKDSYADHPDSGSYEKYTASGYSAYSDHEDEGYDEYSRYWESGYSEDYSEYTRSGYDAYPDHWDEGTIGYEKYVKSGYSAYSDHTNTYTDTGYNNHSDNSGYNAYSDHSDKH